MVPPATTGMLAQHITAETSTILRRPPLPVVDTKSKVMVLKDRRETFMRSASLDRLRQFPAYLCTQGSSAFPNVLAFLNSALSLVQAGFQTFVQAVRKNSLRLAVFGALFLILFQLMICGLLLSISSKPPGLFFMLASMILMAVIAHRTFNCEFRTKRQSRRC